MKITAIILLSACLTASASGFSQITLSEKNAPLQKVLKKIQQQSGYEFLCPLDLLQKAGNVTVELKNVSIEEAVRIVLAGKPLGYSISDKTIVIKEKPSSPKEENPNETFLTTIDVSGKVTDNEGNPLAGASVKVKGTTNGTTTDASGVFVLKGVDENAVLIFSYAEHETIELKVGGRTSVSAALKRKESPLDEVQIIAYGTTTKRLSTGNISTVKAADIEKQPVTNPLLALQGRVAGLVVTQNTGVPGGGVTVRIQGTNSIANGNDPLIIVDGVPYPSQNLSTTRGGSGAGSAGTILGKSGGTNGEGGNPLNYINPNDIQSIEVLKDADATAIYGSRAANGAILITTKKGKAGKMRVDLNLQQGWGKVAKHVDMFNTQEYLMMRREAFKNDGLAIPIHDPNATDDYDLTIWDSTRYTDWQKELIGGTAQYSNINLGVSGGTSNVQYRVGGTYNRTTTVFRNNQPTSNASVNFNFNTTSANQKFRLQLGGSYLFNAINLPFNDVTYQAVTLSPNAPAVYKADGSLNWEPNAAGSSTWTNPLALQQAIYEQRTNNLISNLFLSYKILPGLEVKSSFGYNQMQTGEFYAPMSRFFRPEAIPNMPANRSAAYTNSRISSWITEPQVSYHKALGKSNIDLLLGGTVQSRRNTGEQITGTGYSSDQVLRDFRSASRLTLNTLYSEYKYAAVFGRLNFNWASKYLLNITVRRDGSSRFGPENRYHNFGAVAAGWVFTGEHFVEKNLPWLSFGKIKASIGTTGSDQIGDYSFQNLFSSIPNSLPYQGVVGVRGTIFNPYLAWEGTKKLQAGLELGFFKDRIMVSATYAINRSSNQLLNYDLPIMTGVTRILTNFPATVENTSWEFSLNTVNLKKKEFSWESNFNLTIPRNKLVSFPNLEKSSYANNLIVGKPLGTFKNFAYAGVDPATGLYQVYDKDGKPTSTPNYPDDLTSYVTSTIKFYGGLENRVNFKGFQLDFLFQFAQQEDGANLMAFIYDPGSYQRGGGNQPRIVLRRWQHPGDVNDIQRFSTTSLPSTSGDHFFTEIRYLKLRNLSLGYRVPQRLTQKVHIDGCNIYLRGQNLFTFTNYDGFDPEIPGISALPPLRVITVGAQITF